MYYTRVIPCCEISTPSPFRGEKISAINGCLPFKRQRTALLQWDIYHSHHIIIPFCWIWVYVLYNYYTGGEISTFHLLFRSSMAASVRLTEARFSSASFITSLSPSSFFPLAICGPYNTVAPFFHCYNLCCKEGSSWADMTLQNMGGANST